MKFIKLTFLEEDTVIVNSDAILSIYTEEGVTKIQFSGCEWPWAVIETPEQIMDKICA